MAFRFFKLADGERRSKGLRRPTRTPHRTPSRDPYFAIDVPKLNVGPYFHFRYHASEPLYGLSAKNWVNLLTRNHDWYETIAVPKRDGGQRYISKPRGNLRRVHRAMLEKLQDPSLFHKSAFAYVKGRSPYLCAMQHKNAKWFIKIDLKDFFHSIDEKMIYWALRERGMENYAAFAGARLCTRVTEEYEDWQPAKYKRPTRHGLLAKFSVVNSRLGFLPQGGSASGALSNLVCYKLDVMLADLAKAQRLTYTRYADDIVISGKTKFNRIKAERALAESLKTIERFGFVLNRRKTRIVTPGARKQILGLLVGDGRVDITGSMKRRIEHDLWAIEKYGFSSHAVFLGSKSPLSLLNQVFGRLVWAHQANPEWANLRLARLKALAAESHEELGI